MEVYNDYKGSPEQLDEVKVNWNLHFVSQKSPTFGR